MLARLTHKIDWLFAFGYFSVCFLRSRCSSWNDFFEVTAWPSSGLKKVVSWR